MKLKMLSFLFQIMPKSRAQIQKEYRERKKERKEGSNFF